MRVRAPVDRHAGKVRGEVGAVIDVESAQAILVGLAGAAMLRDDQARDTLEHFPESATAEDRRCFGVAATDAVIVLPGALDRVELLYAVASRRRRCKRREQRGA